MMRRLRSRAVAFVAVVALVPLATLGALAISRARHTLLEEARRTNQDLALRSAAQIETRVIHVQERLDSLALAIVPSVLLTPGQVGRILRDQRSATLELRTLDYVREDGREWATGRLDPTLRERSGEEAVRRALAGSPYRSAVRIADDDVPELTIAIPQRAAGRVVGALIANVDLTEMWRIIDTLKVGERGYARVVGQDGTLIAIGNHALKQRVFTGEKDDSSAIVKLVLAGERPTMRYPGFNGEEVLGVGQPIGSLGWGLILEQPVAEALAPYLPFRATIFALSGLLLAVAALAGFLGARSIVSPIERLRLRAGEIARGLLDARVEIAAPEELAALAEAMNSMSADLIRLQDDLRKKERIATLGRLAAGLAHDLKHPVRALQVNARLVLERPQDPEVRRVFGEVVQREFRKLERFLEDLKRVSRDGAIEFSRDEFDARSMVQEFVDEQRGGNAPACVEIVYREAAEPMLMIGNRELLQRVLSNLASNAYEAMEGEGQLSISAARTGERIELRVQDSGPGIPPDKRQGLFSDFETTKRRGLGLGLAVSKKIVIDHGGTIDVESEPGQGATFVIQLPAAGQVSEAMGPVADRSSAASRAQVRGA